MQDDQPANRTSELVDSLQQALTTADDLGLVKVGIYLDQALLALGVQTDLADFRQIKK